MPQKPVVVEEHRYELSEVEHEQAAKALKTVMKDFPKVEKTVLDFKQRIVDSHHIAYVVAFDSLDNLSFDLKDIKRLVDEFTTGY